MTRDKLKTRIRIGFGLSVELRSSSFIFYQAFVETVRNKKVSDQVVEEEVCKAFFFKSTEEEVKKYIKAMVGITVTTGLAFGVSQSLIEEGIFIVIATPLGPNIYVCLRKRWRVI